MSPLTLLIAPPLPVLVAALMALLVFALTALSSKKVTERLAKGQGEPSGVEAGFYWLHTVSKWGAIALLSYLCVGSIVWIAGNNDENVTRIFDQAGMVIVILVAVVIVPLAAVFIPVSLRMQTIEKNAAKEGADLENNREYKALKALDDKLWFLHVLFAPFFLALAALALLAIAKLFFNL